MTSGLKSGVRGNSAKQGDQLTSRSRIKSAGQLHFELVRGLLGTGENPSPDRSESNRMSSPVRRMRLTFDKSVLFKFVNKPNHGISVHAQYVGKLLLGLTVHEGELAEHPKLARM